MTGSNHPVSSDTVDLLRRVREGDDQAARELCHQFLHRLVGLARKKLPPKLNRRVDPEDIAQSVLRSFFVHARDGDYIVRESEQLWRLLAAITVNKVRNQIRKHTAAKRNVNKEASVSATDSLFGLEPEALAQDPSVDHWLAFEEQLNLRLVERTPLQRQIILLLLQGHSDEMIEKEAKCTRRTVQRTKRLFKQQLENDLEDTRSLPPRP